MSVVHRNTEPEITVSLVDFAITDTKSQRTILRAIYPAIASLVIYDGQNLAQSSARLHFQPRIRGSREKHNRRDL